MHLMVREGSPDVTLAYLSKHRNMLAVSMFSDGQSKPASRISECAIATHLSDDDMLTRGQQPRHKDETYDITPTTYPSERVRIVTRRSTG